MRTQIQRMPFWSAGVLLILLTAFCAPLAAQNDQLCINTVGGLAGNPTLDGVVTGDNGWNAATSVNLSGDLGSTTATAMQIGQTATDVWISMVVSTPLSAPEATIVLGFSTTNNAAQDWRFHIQPFDNTGQPAPGGFPFAVTTWRNSGPTGWNAMAPVPAPVTAGAGDWRHDNIRITKGGSFWELEMRIPKAPMATSPESAGIFFPVVGNAPNTFKMYVDVLNVVFSAPAAVGQDVWPPCPAGSTTATCPTVIQSGVLTRVTPATTVWGTVSLFSRNQCTGVSLSWSDIGVRNPNPPGDIIQDMRRFAGPFGEMTVAQCQALADAVNPGSNGGLNTFVAIPKNSMANPAQVSVQFKMANWGIPGPGQFKFIGTPVPAGCETTGNCSGVTGNPTMQAAIGAGTVAVPTPGNYSATWTLNFKQSCFYHFETNTAAQNATNHQCIQVEMTSTDPATVLLNKSVQKNMNFGPGSTFQRFATISGDQGSLPNGATRHRFIIQIETDRDGTETVRNDAVKRTMRNQSLVAQAREHLGRAVTNVYTWIARGFVYTGTQIVINGKGYDYVRRVGDFGYVVGHTGPMSGWDVSFEGSGLQPVRGNPNLFTAEIAPTSSLPVNTIIKSNELGTGPSGGPARPFATFIHVGVNIPHHTGFDPGFSLNSGLEYKATSNVSVEGIFGYHRINPSAGNDSNLYQFAANLKFYPTTSSPIKPFVFGGGGAYKFGSGSTRAGTNVGAGVQHSLTPKVFLEGVYNIHFVNTPGTTFKFSTVQGGLRFLF